MRLHIGSPPLVPSFTPREDGWSPLREPNPYLLQLLATPIGIVTAGALSAAWWAMARDRIAQPMPWQVVLVLFGVVPVHEVLHALAQPAQGRLPTTILGAWPSRLLFYAHYLGPLSRERLLVILMTPFVGLSILPMLGDLLPIVPGWLALLSVWNGLLSCGDILGVLLVGLQVPQAAIVRNQGWSTWWKVEDEVRGEEAPSGSVWTQPHSSPAERS
jgi:hypothetical protein